MADPTVTDAVDGDGAIPASRPRTHAQETFFVVGEGLLSHSAGGRSDAKVEADAEAPFKFSRIGPKGSPLPEEALRALADAMTRTGGGETGVPAGYTYVGQFVDHDLTMDKTTVMLGANVSPADMKQGRSPALDLDSLYGAGPQDPGSERFYAPDGLRLRVGRTDDGKPFDLARKGKRAVIADHRNDENLAVAQTHLGFIKFHNRVLQEFDDVPEAKRFARARRAVVLHYQWMLRHDYLPRICAPRVVDAVFSDDRRIFEVDAKPSEMPTMPLEFSVAAFRLGHSMIRAEYQWNLNFQDGGGRLEALFEFSGLSGSVTEASPLPGVWPIDWRRFIDFAKSGHKGLAAPQGRFNLAKRIDTRIVNPLGNLPLGAAGVKKKPADALELNLAFRNLKRGQMVSLASGQQMVQHLKDRGVTVTALSKDEIVQGAGGASLADLSKVHRDAIVENTPLWFYILREAELNGGRLKGVGARIVAETFHRAMEGSKTSIVRDRDFKPRFSNDRKAFDMADLLFFAFDGDKERLSPAG